MSTRQFIGTLDQKFIGDLEDDNIFVLRGKQWKVLKIDEESFKVNVISITQKKETPVPKWEGVNIPVDFKTANKVGNFRTRVRNGSVKMMNDIILNIEDMEFDFSTEKWGIKKSKPKSKDSSFGSYLDDYY